MIGWIRVIAGLPLIVFATILVAVFQPIALKTGLFHEKYVPRYWHRFTLKVLGIRLRVHGEMAPVRPLLLASNHTSWADIMAIGSVADIHFIAKADMIHWPVMGWLTTLQRTVFVERQRRGRSGKQANEIGERLAAGDPMVLFAEGTTSDGNLLMPFNSTLFGAAKMALAATPEGKVYIQPVAIAYTRLHGIPMGRRRRGHVAWIGDQDLLPHLAALLRLGAVDGELHFGKPVAFDAGSSRKEVARLVEEEVRAMFVDALHGPAPLKGAPRPAKILSSTEEKG